MASTAGPAGTAAAVSRDFALLRGFPVGGVFARQDGQSIGVAQFLGEVAALASLLPAHGHVVNLCRNRYRFAVGFAAALCRGQITLLPPGDTAAAYGRIAAAWGDTYWLTDGADEDVPEPRFRFPAHLDPTDGEMPAFPPEQAAVVLFTSGSTGQPQPHGRDWGTLVRSTRAAGAQLRVARLQGGTLVGTVPLQHSYGLESVMMLAFQHGLALHAGHPFFPADIRAALAEAPRPRLLVTTPVHLRALLDDPMPLPALDFLLSATAPLPPATAALAEQRFATPLHEIYGCSEAGQIAVRRTTDGPAWRCIDGVILDQNREGCWADGPSVPRPTWLSDAIELLGDGRFLLRGRLADTVNIAGKRASLAALTHHLTAIPGVQDGVFVVPPEDGVGPVRRLAAFAVAPGLTPEAILAALRQAIDPAFLPRPLRLLDALPRNALGKLTQEAMAPLLHNHGEVTLQLAGDHPAGPGHFPGNPILPGAVLLDEILAAIATRRPGEVCREVVSARFLHAVRPGERLTVAWAPAADGCLRFTAATSVTAVQGIARFGA